MERHEIHLLLLNALHRETGRVREADLRALSDADWETLRALAIRLRVGPLLFSRLAERGLSCAVPPEIMDRLRKRYERNAHQVLKIYAELHKLARALQDDHIPIIVLKGAYLASEVYDNIALREMNDLDILVHRSDLAQVAKTMTTLGYTPLHSFSIEPELCWEMKWGLHHLPRFMKPNAAGVDVHLNITPPDMGYSIVADELWERAQPATIAGADVLGLAPEDLLLHLAMHTAYQHNFAMGLRPSCDIAAVVRRYEESIRWEHVQQRAERWGWRRGAHLAFRLAQELVGAAVPDEVLRELRPAGFDEALLAAARAQAFAKAAVTTGIPPGLAQLRGANSFRDKAMELLRSVFLSPQVLSRVYGVPPGSPRIYLYYPVRLKDALMRRSRAMWRLMRSDQETVLAAKRNNTLQSWLTE